MEVEECKKGINLLTVDDYAEKFYFLIEGELIIFLPLSEEKLNIQFLIHQILLKNSSGKLNNLTSQKLETLLIEEKLPELNNYQNELKNITCLENGKIVYHEFFLKKNFIFLENYNNYMNNNSGLICDETGILKFEFVNFHFLFKKYDVRKRISESDFKM